MKKKICAGLLAAVMLLSGCGGKKDDAPVRKTDSDMIIITESYAEEGHYTDSLDNSWTYSYHVPQLTADTKGARAIKRGHRPEVRRSGAERAGGYGEGAVPGVRVRGVEELPL